MAEPSSSRDAYKKKEGMSQDDAKVAYAAKLKEVNQVTLHG